MSRPPPDPPGRRAALATTVTAAALFALALAVALMVGPAPVDAWALLRQLVGGAAPGADDVGATIVGLRLTRAVAAGIAGGALGLSGLLLQTATRNPLADPYLLGTSGGATLSAVALLTLAHAAGLGAWVGRAEPLLALVGALAAAGLAMRVGHAHGGGGERVILAGLVITAFAGAATSLLLARADDASLRAATQWLMGGVAVAEPAALALPGAALVALWLWTLRVAAPLDALRLGVDAAAGLGVDARRTERLTVAAAAALAAIAVALTGIVGFVGLLVPHGARALVGASHARLLPAVAWGGAAFLVAVDATCRWVVAPAELPMGIPTALAGVPLLFALLRRRSPVRRLATVASRSAAAPPSAPPHAVPTLNHGAPQAGVDGQPPRLLAGPMTIACAGEPLLEVPALPLRAGDLVVVVGRNGTGKSTLLRTLAGVAPPAGGIAVHGGPMHRGVGLPLRALRAAPATVWLPQRVELDEAMTVAELIALAAALDGHDHTPGARGADGEARRQRALQAADVEAYLERKIGGLSGGQRQRAALALALARDADAFVLDEPTAALDVGGAAAAMRALARLAHDHGALIVASSHDLGAALPAADAVIVLAEGVATLFAAGDSALPAAIASAFGLPQPVVAAPP